MGKKRKSQESSNSIDVNQKKKAKKMKDVMSEDVTENLNHNDETVLEPSISKKRKNKKVKADDVAEGICENSETVVQSESKKRRKDKKNNDQIAEEFVKNVDGDISVEVSSNEKRKSKKNKDVPSPKVNAKSINEDGESTIQSTHNLRSISNSRTPKKIIFVDDEPQEVSVTASNETKRSKPFKKTKEHNNEMLKEEDVKDEDIDKFCDELSEEDNKQYENWVQLIEASLSSNKKKPK